MKKLAKITAYSYLLIVVVLFVLFEAGIINYLWVKSAFYAGLINLINATVTILLFEFSYKRKNKDFLVANLGGMAAKIIVSLVSIFLILKFVEVNQIAFLLIFFIIYFILLTSEVVYFHKKVKVKIRKNSKEKN